MIRLDKTIISDSALRNINRIEFDEGKDEHSLINIIFFGDKNDLKISYVNSAAGLKLFNKELKIIYKRLDKLDDEARDFAADYQKFMGINPGFFSSLNNVED